MVKIQNEVYCKLKWCIFEYCKFKGTILRTCIFKITCNLTTVCFFFKKHQHNIII